MDITIYYATNRAYEGVKERFKPDRYGTAFQRWHGEPAFRSRKSTPLMAYWPCDRGTVAPAAATA
jgi:hypothetical protein